MGGVTSGVYRVQGLGFDPEVIASLKQPQLVNRFISGIAKADVFGVACSVSESSFIVNGRDFSSTFQFQFQCCPIFKTGHRQSHSSFLISLLTHSSNSEPNDATLANSLILNIDLHLVGAIIT